MHSTRHSLIDILKSKMPEVLEKESSAVKYDFFLGGCMYTEGVCSVSKCAMKSYPREFCELFLPPHHTGTLHTNTQSRKRFEDKSRGFIHVMGEFVTGCRS